MKNSVFLLQTDHSILQNKRLSYESRDAQQSTGYPIVKLICGDLKIDLRPDPPRRIGIRRSSLPTTHKRPTVGQTYKDSSVPAPGSAGNLRASISSVSWVFLLSVSYQYTHTNKRKYKLFFVNYLDEINGKMSQPVEGNPTYVTHKGLIEIQRLSCESLCRLKKSVKNTDAMRMEKCT